MSEVFIPLGGAGGKNRGTAAVLGDSTPFSNAGAVMSLPLPAGNYKKSVSNPRANYGDGKNSEVTISKGLLKQMAIDAFGIASITNFRATMYAHKQVRLTWAKPTKGLWSGVHFILKYGSMPDGIYDGFMPVDTADVHYETRPLQEGLLYIRAYSYVETNTGRWYDYDGTPVYTIQVTGISGSVTLGAGAGTWTVPEGVRRIRYILVGHGGNGGSGNGYYVPGGGGGGGYFTTGYMDVTPGQSIPWIVPVRGQVAPTNTATWQNLVNGGNLPGLYTTFGGIVAQHGKPPLSMQMTRGGHHGSGGDGGSGGAAFGGSPGANGNDGAGAQTSVKDRGGRNGDTYYLTIRPGQGQHSSTTGFNGVLYCSGGTAGNKGSSGVGTAGTNGLGNGGNGANNRYMDNYSGGEGGTGCIYIAWGSSMNDGS